MNGQKDCGLTAIFVTAKRLEMKEKKLTIDDFIAAHKKFSKLVQSLEDDYLADRDDLKEKFFMEVSCLCNTFGTSFHHLDGDTGHYYYTKNSNKWGDIPHAERSKALREINEQNRYEAAMSMTWDENFGIEDADDFDDSDQIGVWHESG